MGAATTEDEGFALVMRTQPDLLICTSDLKAGYGIHLLQRVKAACPRTRLMIFLGRETREVVQEALRAYADAVMFRSRMGSATSDFMQALGAIARGMKNPAVANLLGISPETVKTHVVQPWANSVPEQTGAQIAAFTL